ncbi:zinc D-Ala-D-Ala carboxypeptidase [Stackebrandtia albiflava]|uniref:Zinc D-Ala-D-Ala carboxypeptidase n=1 Tax=Stackebrandtia albiflava TaxID=406432 RepID=A0A562URD8_9ACTN|nr:D-Ala-D-Ala carboxypeptidase family metallohydrolase [Stackebrandtia albiflava]TWJ08176.1 zinc D-Ala-D-Ala carboxypeptidase [Stackebrandtia albiflava]
MPNTSRRTFLAAAVAIPTTAAVVGLTGGTAHAAEFKWTRTLEKGMSGSDVKQLQIRVAGYPGYNAVLAIDGEFGDKTAAAVKRFKQAYGLNADGIAGPAVFKKIYALQDSDNTPIHFKYSELNKCNSTWGGGNVSAATAKENARRLMWKLEALRHALGDKPITISSGFRSKSCNSAVGGHSSSRHLYGDAADLTGSHSFCTMAKRARYHGFANILGPGYPGHSDHVHVASGGTTWSASRCF